MQQTKPLDEQPLWPWNKAPARPSLVRLGQEATARGWILNLVQLGHWLVLLSVLPVAWVAFSPVSYTHLTLPTKA